MFFWAPVFSHPKVVAAVKSGLDQPQLSYLKSDSNSVWASALILRVQVKMIMLIQHAEKKENSSSKRHEMSKWSFYNAILVTDWNTVHCHIALY